MNVREKQRKNTEADDTRRNTFDARARRNPDEAPVTDHSRTHTSLLGLRLFISIAFLALLADQVTKWIVVRTMYLHESIPMVPGVFSITRVHNSGIAFGLFPGMPDLFMVITFVSMLIVVYFYLTVEPRSGWLTVGCSLILGGAMGNLLDRFRYEYVVDFLHFSFWPAFNVADSCVSTGVVLLLISFFREKKGMAGDASRSVQNRTL